MLRRLSIVAILIGVAGYFVLGREGQLVPMSIQKAPFSERLVVAVAFVGTGICLWILSRNDKSQR